MLSAGKKIESERRLVTILFADISGFTALSEKLDPEIVLNILPAFTNSTCPCRR
ncbi:MAG: hypothetical protein IIB40_11950 [Candidatus Marinimicrobia bacterium]|nr:hypothetical protein [Candidatus Neomarinimicrobiota bacterium]